MHHSKNKPTKERAAHGSKHDRTVKKVIASNDMSSSTDDQYEEVTPELRPSKNHSRRRCAQAVTPAILKRSHDITDFSSRASGPGSSDSVDMVTTPKFPLSSRGTRRRRERGSVHFADEEELQSVTTGSRRDKRAAEASAWLNSSCHNNDESYNRDRAERSRRRHRSRHDSENWDSDSSDCQL